MARCYSCMQLLPDKKLHTCPHCGEPLKLSCDTTQFLPPGSVLQKKFIVGKVLGSGGFGNTYIGWNQVLQCRVAIKEYFPKHLSGREKGGDVTVSDSVSRKRFRAGLLQFLEEARSIANLQDVRGVVQVYNFFEENGTGYIIMEFLEGMDVKTIMKRRGQRMDYDWSRRVMLTVLHTLREIHKRGILHRDIAPDNIFVTKEGVIKLIDFGAAKHATELANTHADIVLKAGYAPIEQYSKKTKQGPYTDLYAVAAMFYRMLTGVKPRPANERMTEDNLLPLSEMGVELPEQAELAIMVCLNVNPEYRLQSANEFMQALDGENFVPVYEPEWILPEVEEKETLGAKIQQLSFPKKAALLTGAVAVVGLAALGVVSIYSRMQGEVQETVSVSENILPQYEGKSEKEVEKDLKKYGITPKITYSYNPDSRENTVISMEPSAGTGLNGVDTLYLKIDSSQILTMPDYKGKGFREIQDSLKDVCKDKYHDAMFSYNYTSDGTKKDCCYSQSGTGNISVEDLAGFTVQISWGKEKDYQVKMPDLSGMTVSQAKKKLKKAGLSMKVSVTKNIEDASERGTILEQDITRGQIFNTNQADGANYDVPGEVRLTVSKGVTVTPTPKPTPRPTRKPRPSKTSKPKPAKTPKAKEHKDKESVRDHHSGM